MHEVSISFTFYWTRPVSQRVWHFLQMRWHTRFTSRWLETGWKGPCAPSNCLHIILMSSILPSYFAKGVTHFANVVTHISLAIILINRSMCCVELSSYNLDEQVSALLLIDFNFFSRWCHLWHTRLYFSLVRPGQNFNFYFILWRGNTVCCKFSRSMHLS